MYIEDTISKLEKHIIRFGNCDYYVKSKVDNELRDLAKECIRWSEDDFKQIAIDETSEENWFTFYDESRFGIALQMMIDKHDAEIGINWEVVKYYLNEHCKIKDNTNIYESRKLPSL